MAWWGADPRSAPRRDVAAAVGWRGWRAPVRGCLAALTLLGCGDRGVVEENVLDIDDVPRIVVSERVVLGGKDATGPAAFGSVAAVALFPGQGRMAVGDGTVASVQMFGLDGAYLWSVGGRGFGPGEFQTLRSIAAQADGGFCVWDIQIARVTTFDARGKVLRTAPVDFRDLWAIRPSLVGFAEGCVPVFRDQRADISRHEQQDGLFQDTVRLALFDTGGRFARWLIEVSNAPQWLYHEDRGWGSTSPVFGRSRVALLSGDALLIATTDSLAWTRVSLSGAVLGRIAAAVRVRRVKPSDIEQERSRLADSVRAYYATMGRRLRSVPDMTSVFQTHALHAVEGVPADSTFPVFDRMTAGTNGVVWMLMYPEPRETSARWLALDRNGAPFGALSLPVGSNLAAASHDWLVVLEKDAFDAPVLRILAIEGGIGPEDEARTPANPARPDSLG